MHWACDGYEKREIERNLGPFQHNDKAPCWKSRGIYTTNSMAPYSLQLPLVRAMTFSLMECTLFTSASTSQSNDVLSDGMQIRSTTSLRSMRYDLPSKLSCSHVVIQQYREHLKRGTADCKSLATSKWTAQNHNTRMNLMTLCRKPCINCPIVVVHYQLFVARLLQDAVQLFQQSESAAIGTSAICGTKRKYKEESLLCLVHWIFMYLRNYN